MDPSRRGFLLGKFTVRRERAQPAPRTYQNTQDRPLPKIVRLPDHKPMDALSFLASLHQAPAPDCTPAAGSERLAMITEYDCLAHNGTFCSVCVERCPEQGAITVQQGKPRINAPLCTGCGECQSYCPAPGNAIVLVPQSRDESHE